MKRRTGSAVRKKKTDLDDEVSKKRQRELQTIMDNAFGAGAAIVTVHADVDMDSSKTVTDQQTPSGASVVNSQKETVTGSSSPAGGLTGVIGQNKTPSLTTSSTDPKSGYVGETKNKQFLINDVQNETMKATGAIKGMAINVVIDSGRISDKGAVEKMLIGDLGDRVKIDPITQKLLPNQAYSVTVTSIAFDKTAAKEAVKEAAAASSQQRIQQILSMLPIAALLLVAAMVVKQIAKFAKSQSSYPVAMTPEGMALPMSKDTTLANPAPASGELTSLLAELDGTSLVRRPHPEEDLLEVEDIKNRIHMPLEQLKKMSQERPALVAQLIKSMLLEERK